MVSVFEGRSSSGGTSRSTNPCEGLIKAIISVVSSKSLFSTIAAAEEPLAKVAVAVSSSRSNRLETGLLGGTVVDDNLLRFLPAEALPRGVLVFVFIWEEGVMMGTASSFVFASREGVADNERTTPTVEEALWIDINRFDRRPMALAATPMVD